MFTHSVVARLQIREDDWSEARSGDNLNNMHKTLISTNSAQWCRANANNPAFVSEELFKDSADGHKFKAGDKCRLVGLVDFPEFNGQKIEITAIRENGACGKAYYIKGPINKFVNWIYEYRLETP